MYPDETVQIDTRFFQNIHLFLRRSPSDGVDGNDRTCQLAGFRRRLQVAYLQWREAIIAYCQFDETSSNGSPFDTFGQVLRPE